MSWVKEAEERGILEGVDKEIIMRELCGCNVELT